MYPLTRGARRAVRSGALALTLAAGLGGPVVLSSSASAAPDDSAARIGASWLSGELTDGLMHNAQWEFDDLGLSADTAMALSAVGGQDATVASIVDAIEPRAASEWYASTWDGTTTTYGGSVGKAAVLSRLRGDDPRAWGGHDLVALLEQLTADQAPVAGRLQDQNNAYGDANVIGQAFAARALTEAGSAEASAARSFLLQQQCPDGGFRLFFNADRSAAQQRCTTAAESQPDVTALVALQLIPLRAGDPAAGPAVSRALDWLAARQQADGSLGGGPSTEAANTNSTGLAGWAFGSAGRTGRAASAATWIRRHQAFDPAPCTTGLTPDPGAVAYDATALAGARQGDGAHGQDQWRRASAQAVPALRWAPGADAAYALSGPTGYVRAGSKQWLTLTGLAPQERACVSGPNVPGGIVTGNGATKSPVVTLPAGTGSSSYQVVSPDGVRSVTLRALGATTLNVRRDFDVRRRRQVQVVRASGLAPGEPVKLWFRSTVVRRGVADSAGAYVGRFTVTGASGPARVRVTGKFADLRSGTASFRVR